MGEQPPAGGISWFSPDDLHDFVDELRQAGFNIGLEQYIEAQDLVLALAARGMDLEEPDRLKSHLGPLLCSTPLEQENFAQRYEAWARRLRYIPPPRMEKAPGRGLTVRRALIWGGIAAALLALGAAIYYLFNQISSTGVPAVGLPISNVTLPEYDRSWLLPLGLAGLGLLMVLAYRLYMHYWARMYLERQPAQQTPGITFLHVSTTTGQTLYPSMAYLRLAQGLRRRMNVPSERLEIAKTVLKTAEKGGWFTPVPGAQRVMPEYLALVDRTRPGRQQARLLMERAKRGDLRADAASERPSKEGSRGLAQRETLWPEDHQARYMSEMIARLSERQVFVTTLYFDGDPRLCFPVDGGPPRSLWEITTQYQQHRLLLFTDGGGLFDPISGELARWTDMFLTLPERVILTPEAVEHWGAREVALSERFEVLPSTQEGLALFIKKLQGNEEPPSRSQEYTAPLPGQLRRPRRWLSPVAPSEREVKAMLAKLKDYLGPQGFLWVSACAVYPKLHWELTLYLGDRLNSLRTNGRRHERTQDQATADHETARRRLLNLARLPWMRAGFMPDWLRLRLLDELPKEDELNIRQALNELLVSALQTGQADLALEIAHWPRPSLQRLTPFVVQRLARLAGEDRATANPYRDYVFLTYMTGRKASSLAVRLPEMLRQLFAPPPSLVKPEPIFAVWWALANLVGALFGAVLGQFLAGALSASLPRLAYELISYSALATVPSLWCWLLTRRYVPIGALWPALYSLSYAIGFIFALYQDQLGFNLGRGSGLLIGLLCGISLWIALGRRMEYTFGWMASSLAGWGLGYWAASGLNGFLSARYNLSIQVLSVISHPTNWLIAGFITGPAIYRVIGHWAARSRGELLGEERAALERQQTIVRSLYAWEIQEAQIVFADSIDYQRVRIHEFATWPNTVNRIGTRLRGVPYVDVSNAITLGNSLYFPVGLLSTPVPPSNPEHYKIAWLMHELTHVWQSQHLGILRYLRMALSTQTRYSAKAYDFGGESGLVNATLQGLRLNDFNIEQQADIASTYYRRLVRGQDVSAWLPYIREMQGADREGEAPTERGALEGRAGEDLTKQAQRQVEGVAVESDSVSTKPAAITDSERERERTLAQEQVKAGRDIEGRPASPVQTLIQRIQELIQSSDEPGKDLVESQSQPGQSLVQQVLAFFQQIFVNYIRSPDTQDEDSFGERSTEGSLRSDLTQEAETDGERPFGDAVQRDMQESIAQDNVYIGGGVKTGGGDFVGGDRRVYGDEVRGDQVGGDTVSGDKYVVDARDSASVAIGRGAREEMKPGLDAGDLVMLFAAIYQHIQQRPEDPDVEKEEITQTVQKIQQEAAKGEEAQPNRVERWLKTLNLMAPDIFEATAATLANPIPGISAEIRKVAKKAQAEASA